MATKTTKSEAKTSSKATVTSKKSVKKSTPRTATKSRSQVQAKTSIPILDDAPQGSSTQSKSLKFRRTHILIALAVIALGIFLYAARGLFVAAVVNGQPISRVAVVRETEKQSGKEALNTLVRNALIEQEAGRVNVTVSDDEINTEVKKVEDTLSKQGQKLDQVLTMQGMTREDLRKLIRLDKLVGKIVGKDVKVTDKEVTDYIEANKETLPQDQSEADLKKTVSERLKQQKLSEKVQKWLEDIQKKANIIYFVQY